MVAKKHGAKAADLEIVLTAIPGETALAQRIESLRQAAARARLKVDLALFSNETSPGPGGPRRISAPPGHSSQAALVLAAQGSSAQRLIFWPSTQDADASVLSALVKASGKCDWVLAPRGPVPPAAGLLQKALGLRVPVDLGAPSILDRKRLAELAGGLTPWDAFIAARLMRAGECSALAVGLLETGKKTLDPAESLGLDKHRLAANIKKRSDGLLLGGALVGTGLWLQSWALLSLLLFGFGILVLGYSFGKAQ